MESGNLHKKIRKEYFGPFLRKALDKIDLPEVMKNGFKECGPCPFPPDVLAVNKLLKKTKEDPPSKKTSPNADNAAVSYENSLQLIEQNMDPGLLDDFKKVEESGV